MSGRIPAPRADCTHCNPAHEIKEPSHDPPAQFSDDVKTVVTTSLQSPPGKAIGWNYTDGSSDTATLF